YWLGNWQIMELAAFMTVLVFIRHHQNIRRLLSGSEPRIGAKKST
ncbi:MAG: glycerol-3-phosphate acyltransferase, partial [Alphaproteobacteria bacterium]|nr:glycerol-3-phosphate acyltransferase [Alphaproteobacteria bacterium]